MNSIGRLNSEMEGRISLNLMGKTCFRILPEKNEAPLSLMKTVLSGLDNIRKE